ncbi:MAG: hypothetical protein R3B52_01425 [Candidatus Paceibacterota bacterium]
MQEEKVNPKQSLPTQSFVEVKEVKDGIAILKNGALRQIVMVSGINFDLKSEEEKEALIFGYQNFLNSLDFPIQIFVHSRKINVDRYIEGLSQIEVKEPNPLLRTQIAEYREFIRTLVNENIIMHKSFFVVVPYDPVQLSQAGKKAAGGLFKLISKDKLDPLTKTSGDENIREYVSQLKQRTDEVVSSLNQIGLRAVPLNDEETTELFYNLYNPEAIEKKGLVLTTDQPNA